MGGRASPKAGTMNSGVGIKTYSKTIEKCDDLSLPKTWRLPIKLYSQRDPCLDRSPDQAKLLFVVRYVADR